MQISQNKVAIIEYTLTNDAGQVLDTSKGREPLAYIHGGGNIIPGLEKALAGKVKGDAVKAKISPEEGYGLRDEALIQQIPRSRFQNSPNLEIGMQFQARSQGGVRIATITKIDGDNVTVDLNHELAGVTLNFDVTIVDVRDASQEELDHGHVHGTGGHHH